mgnify:CR=1 FL=1
MSSSLVRVALNALRNQKPMLVPSSYSNTYSIVEVDTSLHTARLIYNKECKKIETNKGRGWATPHMFFKQK